jgi:hypothetical protein
MNVSIVEVLLRKITTLGVVICLLYACQPKSGGIPIVNVDNPSGNTELSLSDILEDIRIVPLETSSAVLIENSPMTCVSDNYIVAANEQQIHLFDKNGKHLKVLMVQGRGPNEYFYLTSPLIDEKRNILYYRDGDKVHRINLPDGTFLEPLMDPLENVKFGAMDKEGYFYYFPTSGESVFSTTDNETATLVYKFLPETGEIQTFSGSRSYIADRAGLSMTHYMGEVNFFNSNYSDTLFSLSGKRLVSQGYFDIQNRLKKELSDGDELTLISSFKDGHIMYVNRITTTSIDTGNGSQGFSRRNQFMGFYVFDRKGSFTSLKKMHIDPLAFDIDATDRSQWVFSPIPQISGGWGYIGIDAIYMIDFIEKAIEKNTLPAAQIKKLEEARAKIDENSNPVLIIGRVK